MQRVWLVFALLAGCSRYFGDDGPNTADDPPPLQPDAWSWPADPPPPGGTCAHDVALSIDDDMFRTLPVTLDAAGTSWCVRLDATRRTHPTYFSVRTGVEAAPPPSFGVAIHDVNGQLLSGVYPDAMSTYASAEYEVQADAVFYVQALAWTHGSKAQATTLYLSLYQILD